MTKEERRQRAERARLEREREAQIEALRQIRDDPQARFPQGVEVGGCTIGISGPDLSSAAFRAGADIVRSESGGDGMLFRASPSAYLDENPKRKIHL